ncbi:hypothetical protein AJ80_08741 [Polytolypa hystricis UAMH7299]|uniref:Uncharacterized protein n=1 Tax=Polytolypa hystricis (strain UAMH7299) TaxID=1447883 RepID=A0A2B7X2J4_POLH7|nr:hypothetical protein AJ80_08741 [Polytolypa hystricis UAMH7299]
MSDTNTPGTSDTYNPTPPGTQNGRNPTLPNRQAEEHPVTFCATILPLIFLGSLLFNVLPLPPLFSPSWPNPPELKGIRERLNPSSDIAACWPSTGGAWAKHLSPVEMAYLGLDRFTLIRASTDSPSEDEFCTRLRRMGADFYMDREVLEVLWRGQYKHIPPATLTAGVEVAFDDEGGMWAVKSTGEVEMRGDLRRALTMKERVDIIKRFGGRYCDASSLEMEEKGIEMCEAMDWWRNIKKMSEEFVSVSVTSAVCLQADWDEHGWPVEADCVTR